MRTIIAGSRGITDYAQLEAAVDASGFHITEVVSGCARGADALGEEYARRRGIPIARYPAKWDEHGRAAGAIRNVARNADALIALWDGRSKGTAHMISVANRAGLKCYKWSPGEGLRFLNDHWARMAI